MVNKLFDFFPFGRKKPAVPKERPVPETAPGRAPREAQPELEDLGEILTGARPEPAAAEIPLEPPTVLLPPEPDPRIDAGFRSVKDSVETLKQRALTARQLRETIEHTIESRVGDLRESVGRIQDLLKAQPPRTTAGEGSDQLAERLASLEARVDCVARELPSAISGLVGDAPGAIAKLAEDLALRDARVLAWLERVNVALYAASKDAEKSAEERAAHRALLEELRREKVRVEALRKRLYQIRDRLNDGMVELRDGVARNVFSRALLTRRIEAALQPFESAVDALESLIKELE